MIGRIVFSELAFTRENGFLRPNLKLDRKKIAQHFLAGTVDSSKAIARSA